MPVLRNRLSEVRSGGPRQFAELRDKIILRASSRDDLPDLTSELFDLGLETESLTSEPLVVAQPENKVEDVIDRVARLEDSVKMRQAVDEVSGNEEDEIIDISNATIAATERLRSEISSIPGVANLSFVLTYTDFGPENLRLAPDEMIDIAEDRLNAEGGTLGDLNEKFNMEDVWEMERGDQAVSVVFDTGFAEGLISPSRIIRKIHSDDTDDVFASAEGHGTMTAGAMAASKDDGLPFNGTAPGSDVILVRITDSDGQIRSDVIAKAWDEINSMDIKRPMVLNHSYGTPICSGRPRTRFCNSPEQDLIKRANSTTDIISFYAAGNEAMACGHRPSGLTNGITSTNSIGEVITVGALLFNGREAQKYSSHGRGDCSPVDDPKPNVTAALPSKTYYGVEDGWKIKDMSSGIFGSSGGTSHATPWTAGIGALMQSRAMKERGEPLSTEELKQILHNTSVVPHATHVNRFGLVLSESGYDARFGHGQVRPMAALEEI